MFKEIKLYPTSHGLYITRGKKVMNSGPFAPTAIPSQNQSHVNIYIILIILQRFSEFEKTFVCRAQDYI